MKVRIPACLGGSAVAIVLVTAHLSAPPAAPAQPGCHFTPVLLASDPRGQPDLTSSISDVRVQSVRFRAGDCAVVEGEVSGTGKRKLLRFTTTYPNTGAGSLIVGAPTNHPDLFELNTCHGHPHFKEYADYRLWTPQQYDIWSAIRADPKNEKCVSRELLASSGLQPIEGAKRGFCMIDLVQVLEDADPQTFTSCSSSQGISRGWADVYVWSLDGQWIDVTSVGNGDYILETEVNAERVLEESDYSNNSAAVSLRLPLHGH